eukprot:GFUD01100301.1.p2 GENE.GFUD01100301.1~~GFUD01100301.1.p2  ORF type:complete len:126 (+),score=22.80 GFUD01100301.1:65-442(+)
MCSCLRNGDSELPVVGGDQFLGRFDTATGTVVGVQLVGVYFAGTCAKLKTAGTCAGLKADGMCAGLKLPKFLARSSAALARLSRDDPNGEDESVVGAIFINPGSMSGFVFKGAIISPATFAWDDM